MYASAPLDAPPQAPPTLLPLLPPRPVGAAGFFLAFAAAAACAACSASLAATAWKKSSASWACPGAAGRGPAAAGPPVVEALGLDGLRRDLSRGRHDHGGHDGRLDARAQGTTSVRQRPRQRSARDHDRGNWGTEALNQRLL